MRRFGLALAAVLATTLTGSLRAQALEIPPVPDSVANAHNTIVLRLPADGGYSINHQPVPLGDLGNQFRAIYQPRPRKVLVVVWDRTRSEADVLAVVRLARAEGVTVYGARYHPGDI